MRRMFKSTIGHRRVLEPVEGASLISFGGLWPHRMPARQLGAAPVVAQA
jgi:hypothetical protein